MRRKTPPEVVEYMAKLGDHLRAIRTEKGMTVDELAARCSITGTTLRNYEKGRTQPAAFDVRKLSKALNVTADKLLKI